MIGLPGPATSLAAGNSSSLAVVNGNVYAWGFTTFGSLGDGTTTNRLSAELIDPADLTNIVSVAAAQDTGYALPADGSIWDWGDNGDGELGTGATYYEYLTPQHLLPPPGFVYTSVSANNDGFFAVATLAAVPEPASLTVLAAAMTGLLAGPRRTRLSR